MIGRDDTEGSKSNVAMNAWLPQAIYPCGNFFDTSTFEFRRSKGSLGHAFTVRIRTGSQNQMSFYPSVPHEIFVLVELILGHLRYLLKDVPPQPNSQARGVSRAVHRQPTCSGLGPPCPAIRANPFPEVMDPFCRLPLPTLFHRPEAVHLGDMMRL
ncbi:Regulator of rDNA transcription protein 15 [Capsicum baccatum]|uniref:Regulator of rDNA transcription protein 15 n=1 Tax=Capsicum baccatum TaxID=33114 RepID=A0A2G2V2F4_CAPBA|nr:Regulator of rDNA transcription protein 15 [Capsicum baccatum]